MVIGPFRGTVVPRVTALSFFCVQHFEIEEVKASVHLEWEAAVHVKKRSCLATRT